MFVIKSAWYITNVDNCQPIWSFNQTVFSRFLVSHQLKKKSRPFKISCAMADTKQKILKKKQFLRYTCKFLLIKIILWVLNLLSTSKAKLVLLLQWLKRIFIPFFTKLKPKRQLILNPTLNKLYNFRSKISKLDCLKLKVLHHFSLKYRELIFWWNWNDFCL